MGHSTTWTAREAAANGRPPAGLAELISPLAVESFLADHWGSEPLVIHRDDPEYYAGILTLDDVDAILANSSLSNSDLRLMIDGAETSITELLPDEIEGKVNGHEAVYARYRSGTTINLTFLQERWPPLAAVCRGLANRLSANVHGNVYLTPPGNKALTPHHDTHDVFVLQLYGTKHWSLYPQQVEVPLKNQPYLLPEEGPGEPIKKFTLRAGDLAYLPRGTVHAAFATEDTSLHLTIGVSPMVWASVIRIAVEQVLPHDLRFRAALPPGFSVSPELQESLVTELGNVLEEVVAQVSAKAVVTEVVSRTMQRRQPVLSGHLRDLTALPSVDLDTRLRLRPDLLWRIIDGDEEIIVEFHGKTIGLPAFVKEELAFMAKAEEFTAHDIPGGLDDAGRLVLIRQLLQEGFLTLS